MEIFVKDPLAKTVQSKGEKYQVESSDKVGALKMKIQDRTGIAVKNMQLYVAGKNMENDRTLAGYNVTEGSEMRLVKKHKGAKKKKVLSSILVRFVACGDKSVEVAHYDDHNGEDR